MAGTVTNDARHTMCRTSFKDRRIWLMNFRCIETDAWMIVVEDEYLIVARIYFAADASIARAKIAVSDIFGKHHFFRRDLLSAPRAVLSMCSDDDPFLAQWMPAFFPSHNEG